MKEVADKMEIILEYPKGEIITIVTSPDFELLGAAISREGTYEYYDQESAPEYLFELLREIKNKFPEYPRIKFYKKFKQYEDDSFEISKFKKGELESKLKVTNNEIKIVLPFKDKIVKVSLTISMENNEIEVIYDWYIEDAIPELTEQETEEFWNFFSENYHHIIFQR